MHVQLKALISVKNKDKTFVYSHDIKCVAFLGKKKFCDRNTSKYNKCHSQACSFH